MAAYSSVGPALGPVRRLAGLAAHAVGPEQVEVRLAQAGERGKQVHRHSEKTHTL